jgi:hypothetical protein
MDAQLAMQKVEAIVRALEEQGLRGAPILEATDLALSCPEAVADLAVATMDRFPEGGTFLDAALSYLPEDRWDGLVVSALDALERSRKNEAACSVIAYASLQALTSLHAHLDRIFRLRPNAETYYEQCPWRESGTSHLRFLRGVIEGKASRRDVRLRAWKAMLQTRHPEVLAIALAHAAEILECVPGLSMPETIDAYLNLVGYHHSGGALRRLCPEALFHAVFPERFFEGQSRPPWLARIHPTWALEPAAELPPMRFGGHADGECSLCGGVLHRLISFEPVPQGLGVTELARLELATCLSCLGWEQAPLFYRHERDGKAISIGYDGPTVVPQFPVGPLRECWVRLAETPRRWYWQGWGSSSSREHLNRIGGEPCWVQDAEYPECPSCGEVMSHLMQLDSDLATSDGRDWSWGSGGIGYVSWCDRCKVSGLLWQCT